MPGPLPGGVHPQPNRDGLPASAYALARDLGEPLPYKGRDFALTDIEQLTEPDRRKRLSEIVAAFVAGVAG